MGRLLELAQRLQRQVHEQAVHSNAMFSSEHWKHNAGPDWPEQPDDNSYSDFENCVHPDCVLVRSATPCELCSIEDGLVREWVMKARVVAKSKGLLK